MGRVVATRDQVLLLDEFLSGLEPRFATFAARGPRDMAKAAAALIDLDGLARRIRSLPAGMGAFATRDGCARRGGRSLVHDRDGA